VSNALTIRLEIDKSDKARQIIYLRRPRNQIKKSHAEIAKFLYSPQTEPVWKINYLKQQMKCSQLINRDSDKKLSEDSLEEPDLHNLFPSITAKRLSIACVVSGAAEIYGKT